MGTIRKWLTSEAVEALKAPAKGYVLAWDAGDRSVPGFGVRVTEAGTKSFVLDYRTQAGRQRRITLGRHPALTASGARRLAREALGVVAAGGDPAATRKLAREQQRRTFEALSALYLDHLRQRTHPPTERTMRIYERDYFGRWLLPAFGPRAVTDVTASDLKRLHRRITESGPYLANRVLQLASGIGKFGESIGWWTGGSRLTATIDRNRERARNAERAVMLTPAQLKRLLAAIDEAEKRPGANPYALACVRFLLWSGWRPEEAFNLQWNDLDLATGRARLTRTKTREDGEDRPLLAEAVAVLRSVPRILGYPYVFCGNKPRRPLTHVNRTWRALRKQAGLEELGERLGPMRLRDLRHNFVAQLISRGVDLGMVGRMVGHKSRASTARYGGFAPDVLRALGDEALAKVRSDLKGATDAER
jgi:integrase